MLNIQREGEKPAIALAGFSYQTFENAAYPYAESLYQYFSKKEIDFCAY